MKIRTKINLSFILAFILISSIVGAVVGIYTTGIIKNNVYLYLSSGSRAKAEHIRTFILEQESTSLILAAGSAYHDFLMTAENSIEYPLQKEKIVKHFKKTLEAEPNIYELLILDVKGKIVAASNESEEGIDKSTDTFFTEAKNGAFFKDIYFSTVINKVTYAISAPIKDDDGKFLGVSVLRYLPENLFSIIKNENGLGKTEENFLINKDKIFISPSLFLGDSVILNKKIETKNANDCFNEGEIEYVKKNGYVGLKEFFNDNQINEALDYRNVDVIATHAYIPETGWCLITKADRAELMLFRKTLLIIFIIIFVIASLIYLLLSYIISKRITKPLDVLQIGVNKIQMGDLDYKVNTGTKDEIGVLSDSFNAMVMAVKQSRADIDIKVGEQTKELANKTEDLESQKLAILNVLEDVEKEKRQVEILANDLIKFKLAVENTSEQVFITDVEGMIVYSNKSIENITGFKPSEALGKKAGTLWKLPMTLDYYKNMWDIIKNQKKNYIGEIQNKRKDGEIYTARLNISPVLNDKNEVIYFVAIERDISKEKEVDKAKTEFVSLASHQLRTPLSAINWYTEMLLAGDAGPINEEQKKYLNEVATGNKRMVALVDALLNVSRLDLGTFMIEPEPVNTKEMAKSVIAELQPMIKEKKIEIKEVYGENLPIFNADQKLLRMVLQNLLSNTFKYTPALGTVSLQMRVIQKGEIFGEKVLSGASFAISVGDNGIGIPERQQDKIFSKLFRADNARESETEGTGLGLYVIKSIIDKSGGDVWFKSEENKGTTFYIILPDSGMKKREGTKKLN